MLHLAKWMKWRIPMRFGLWTPLLLPLARRLQTYAVRYIDQRYGA